MSQLRCTLTTPEKTELNVLVDSVTLPLFDGEMGILPGHAPMIGRLGYGIMRAVINGETKKYYVDGGFVQVTRDGVSVLTDRMQSPESIKAADAEEELRTALAMSSSQPALASIKEKAVNRARARRKIAVN